MTSLRRHSPSSPVRVFQTFTGDVHSRHTRDAAGGEPSTPHDADAQYYRLGLLARPGWQYLRWFHGAAARTYCPTDAIKSEIEGLGAALTALRQVASRAQRIRSAMCCSRPWQVDCQ